MNKLLLTLILAVSSATPAWAQEPAAQTPQDFNEAKAKTLGLLKAQVQINQQLTACVQGAQSGVDLKTCQEKAIPQVQAAIAKYGQLDGRTAMGARKP